MIYRKINGNWEKCPNALEDQKKYERVNPLRNEIKSDQCGYIGDVELMYATHNEIFDAISPSTLKEKTYLYILLKQQEKELKDKMSLLNDEIKHLHFAVSSGDMQNDVLKGGNAGEISFQETKKIIYSPEAVEKIKQMIMQNGGNLSKDGKQIIEDKINDKQLQAFEKNNPELAKEIEALKQFKTEIKMVVKPNKDFLFEQEDPNELFKEERKLAESERYQIFRNVLDNATAYENKTLKLNDAEVFSSQIAILKTEFENIKKKEILQEMFNEADKENKDMIEVEDQEVC